MRTSLPQQLTKVLLGPLLTKRSPLAAFVHTFDRSGMLVRDPLSGHWVLASIHTPVLYVGTHQCPCGQYGAFQRLPAAVKKGPRTSGHEKWFHFLLLAHPAHCGRPVRRVRCLFCPLASPPWLLQLMPGVLCPVPSHVSVVPVLMVGVWCQLWHPASPDVSQTLSILPPPPHHSRLPNCRSEYLGRPLTKHLRRASLSLAGR